MSLRKIIRIETKHSAEGMYYGSDTQCTYDMNDEMRHPQPEYDEKLCKQTNDRDLPYPTSGEWYFGFGSKKQARFWIYKTEWLRELHRAGLVVSEYMCLRENVCVGDTQAIFLASESKVSHSILDYFKIKA